MWLPQSGKTPNTTQKTSPSLPQGTQMAPQAPRSPGPTLLLSSQPSLVQCYSPRVTARVQNSPIKRSSPKKELIGMKSAKLLKPAQGGPCTCIVGSLQGTHGNQNCIQDGECCCFGATAIGFLTVFSGASTVAIDNKIEQAMDLVKSHLMYAVREEVEVLKEQIKELLEKNSQLEYENSILKAAASPDTITELQQRTQQQQQQQQQQTQAPPSSTS